MYGVQPAWSPDGPRLAGATDFPFGGVFVAAADGSGRREPVPPAPRGAPEFLAGDEVGAGPAWSPSSNRIAYASHHEGNWELYVAQADGTGQTRRLTTNPAVDAQPSWTRDGRGLVLPATAAAAATCTA